MNIIKTAVLALLVVASATAFAQSDEGKIKASYREYKAALDEDDGEVAVEHLSSSTIAYYDSLRHVAIKADSATIDKMPVMDKLAVLTLKWNLKKSLLEIMEPQDLLIYAIESGLVAKEEMSSLVIKEVKVKGDRASANIEMNGKNVPVNLRFMKENNVWKLDLPSFMSAAATAFKVQQLRSGMKENEFILSLVSNQGTPQANKHLWRPLK